jgi:hypothetical protein
VIPGPVATASRHELGLAVSKSAQGGQISVGMYVDAIASDEA